MDSVATLAAVGRFITYCILKDEYSFPSVLDNAIRLTPAGEEMVEGVKRELPGVANPDTKAAALGLFVAGDSMLIDIERTDVPTVLAAVGNEISERKIRYPWIMGQLLDQAYAELYRHAPPAGALSPRQSYSLLETVPQGVFQLNTLTVGPFGMEHSASSRYFPPLTCGPTYLCEKLDCNIGHHVNLKTGETAAGDFFNKLQRRYPATDSLRSAVVDMLRPNEKFYSLFNTDNLGWLIGNGLTPDEQRTLLRRLLLRVGLNPASPIVQGGSFPADRRTASAKVAEVSEAELFQTLLLFKDVDIIEHLEILIDDDEISLSPTELRIAVASRHNTGGHFQVSQELNRHGVSFRTKQPATTLRTFLQSVYSGEEEQEELEYQLRDVGGDSAYDRLDYFLRDASEEQILDRLVFSSRGSLMRAFKRLQFGKFDIPENAEAEKRLRARLLWKLGRVQQPPAAPDEKIRDMIERVRGFELAEIATTAQWSTVARSAGLDLFVELESILSSTVEFSCWLFVNDHFGELEDRFRYSAARARALTAQDLTDTANDFQYDLAGRNTLGVLVEGLGRVAAIAETAAEKAAEYLRPSVPAYAEHTTAQLFPLRHTRFVCDLTERSRRDLSAALREAQAELARGRALEVRNRLGHAPASFPNHLELTQAAESVARAVDVLVDSGLTPTVFGFNSTTIDTSDRRKTLLRDGLDREIWLYRPSPLRNTSLPTIASQMVIVRRGIISGTLEPIRFEVDEDTPFAEYWHGYRERKVNDPAAH